MSSAQNPNNINANMPPPPQGNPILSYYNEWSDRTPYITRATMIFTVICYLFSFFFNAAMLLGNTPYFSVFSFEIYRLVLSPFVGNSIIQIVLIAFFYPQMGTNMEATMGSSAFLCLLSTITFVTNILFAIVCVALYFTGMVEALFFDCSGFWVVLFGLITIECMQTPDQPRRMFLIPIDFPSKFFPLVLYGFFSLFSGFIMSFAVAIAVGYLYSRGMLDKLKPSSHYLESMEAQGGSLHILSRSKGWILAGAAIGHDAWVAQNSTAAGGAGASWANQQGGGNAGGGGGGGGGGSGESKKPDPFAGPGHRLSSGSSSSGGGGGWLSGLTSQSSPGSASVATATDREAIAARRLAAFGRGGSSSGSHTEEHREQTERLLSGDGDGKSDVQKLMDMGFQRHDAERALGLAGGSLNAALQLLTA